MGVTTWPCPSCGQQQRAEHQNGEAQATLLCAACEEKVDVKEEEKLLRDLHAGKISEADYFQKLGAQIRSKAEKEKGREAESA